MGYVKNVGGLKMYQTNSSYIGDSMYATRQYVAKPSRRISNPRLIYGAQEHNKTAKYRW